MRDKECEQLTTGGCGEVKLTIATVNIVAVRPNTKEQ
tara:strand:+ start:59 stop:169 length:111 start_codon:yes stop_codon:yes gene_type:complete